MTREDAATKGRRLLAEGRLDGQQGHHVQQMTLEVGDDFEALETPSEDERKDSNGNLPECSRCGGPMRRTPGSRLWKCKNIACGRVRFVEAM